MSTTVEERTTAPVQTSGGTVVGLVADGVRRYLGIPYAANTGGENRYLPPQPSEPWDGVRNPTAAKNMREMKQGDMAFFYASGGKGGLKPGIVGIVEIVKE